MLIAGAGALGKEVLGILIGNSYNNEIVFYDEKPDASLLVFGKYRILSGETEVRSYFSSASKEFVSAIGHPRLREKISVRMKSLGGILGNVVYKGCYIHPVTDGYSGCIIQPGAGISFGVTIGEGCAIHANSTIGHNVVLGKFVNIGPNASVIGPCVIGDYAYISAGATVLPNVRIGKNAIVGPNILIRNDVRDFETENH